MLLPGALPPVHRTQEQDQGGAPEAHVSQGSKSPPTSIQDPRYFYTDPDTGHKSRTKEELQKLMYRKVVKARQSVFRILDLWIRTLDGGSGSGSCSFYQWLSGCKQS